MGYGGKGRGGSTSRQEDSKEKKESKSTDKNVSADEIRKLVAKFLKELSSNTNPKKAPHASPEQNLRGDDPCAGVYE